MSVSLRLQRPRPVRKQLPLAHSASAGEPVSPPRGRRAGEQRVRVRARAVNVYKHNPLAQRESCIIHHYDIVPVEIEVLYPELMQSL